MTERFRIITLRENPTRKRKAGGRTKRRRPSLKASQRRRASSRRRKGPRRVTPRAARPRRRRIYARSIGRRGYQVEGLHEKAGRVHFVYWTGAKFVGKKSAGKIYRTEKEANRACHASMKRRPAAYRLARVIPA